MKQPVISITLLCLLLSACTSAPTTTPSLQSTRTPEPTSTPTLTLSPMPSLTPLPSSTRAATLIPSTVPTPSQKSPFDENAILKISVFKSGQIKIEDKEISLQDLEVLLAALAQKNGMVWYYREAAQGEPPSQAMEVIKLVVKYRLPISLSSKPDFSDYVDDKGNSVPRKK